MNEAISVKEAAKMAGLSELTIRKLCQTGELGTALKLRGGKRFQYIVSPSKLKAWLGTN